MDVSTSTAQAVMLLQKSRTAHLAEVARIEKALAALGVNVVDDGSGEAQDPEAKPTGALHPGPRPEEVELFPAPEAAIPRTRGPHFSVRGAVQEVIASVPRGWSTPDLTEYVLRAAPPGRSREKLPSNVRSSLWSLEKAGLIEKKDGLYYSKKPTDAETAPASAETASGSVPTMQEGGSANGTDAYGVRDQGSAGPAELRDHHLGASVMEATS